MDSSTFFFHSNENKADPDALCLFRLERLPAAERSVQVCFWRQTACVWGQRADRKSCQSGTISMAASVSTLLHVAIMRDKDLSNEQLHVVRGRSHKQSLRVEENIPLCSPLRAQLRGSRGGEAGLPVRRTPPLKRMSRCHAHV